MGASRPRDVRSGYFRSRAGGTSGSRLHRADGAAEVLAAIREIAGSGRSIPEPEGSWNNQTGKGREMDTYYNPADLAKFGEIGKDAPELAKKYFDYYADVFKEGELTEREKALIALGVCMRSSAPTASTHIPVPAWTRDPTWPR